MIHYKKQSVYRGRRAIFTFISIILVCVVLRGMYGQQRCRKESPWEQRQLPRMRGM